jgi:hypothetical protein
MRRTATMHAACPVTQMMRAGIRALRVIWSNAARAVNTYFSSPLLHGDSILIAPYLDLQVSA